MIIRIRKLHHPDIEKYKIELVIGWRSFSLTGYWFDSIKRGKNV